MVGKQAIEGFKIILQNTANSGDFSVSGEAVELPVLPHLHVKNVGLISLPLTEPQVKDLIKV